MGQLIRLNAGAPRCPLCGKFFVQRFSRERGVAFWLCHGDKVAIRVDDPFVGRWDQAEEAAGGVDCPGCNARMRWFGNSTGYMKAVCPKKGCGVAVETKEGVDDAVSTTPEKPGMVQ